MGIKADLVRHQHFQYITKKNLIACIHINYSFSATFEICSEVYVTGVLYFIFACEVTERFDDHCLRSTGESDLKMLQR